MINHHVAGVALRERLRREITQRVETLAPLPEVVVRGLELLRQKDLEASVLEKCLLQDPVLVGKLLGVVNSPLYGNRRRVGSIRDAVVVIGYRGLRGLLMGCGAADLLKRDYQPWGHEPRGLMRHCLAVGTAARSLAEALGLEVEQREMMFVAGLLHDIGKLVVRPSLQEQKLSLPADAAAAIRLERERLGMDHAEAGALIAARWGLDAPVRALLGLHHGSTEPASGDRLAAVLRLADAAMHELGIGYLPGSSPAPGSVDPDLKALDLLPAKWDELRSALHVSVPAAIVAESSF